MIAKFTNQPFSDHTFRNNDLNFDIFLKIRKKLEIALQ